MAIYHLSVKTVSRSSGRSATAAAAYRAGVEIKDLATGEVHNYTRKKGVESADLILPEGVPIPAWAGDREALWNAAEKAETRKNSTVAREFEIALPDELNAQQRKDLAHAFARELVDKHGFVADVAIHAPGKEGDNRNHHAHILVTTRRLGPEGFTEKTRELDDLKTGEVSNWRARFAQLQNEHLERAGVSVRVDHRSLKEQGIEREPTVHLGPAAAGFERRTGKKSDVRLSHEREVADRLAKAKEAGELARQAQQVSSSIIDTTTTLADLKKTHTLIKKVAPLVEPGIADFKERFRVYQSLEQAKELARIKALEQAKLAQELERKRVLEEKDRVVREALRAKHLEQQKEVERLKAAEKEESMKREAESKKYGKPIEDARKGEGFYTGVILDATEGRVVQEQSSRLIIHSAKLLETPTVGHDVLIRYSPKGEVFHQKDQTLQRQIDRDRGGLQL